MLLAVNQPSIVADCSPDDASDIQQWFHEKLQRAKKDGPFAELILLTPSIAKFLLDSNEDNRPIKLSSLSSLTQDIASGRFALNGETLVVSACGRLNDGQHRCHAVIETGVAVQCFIVFGVARSSRSTVDQGIARTSGDVLSMEGFPYANHVACVAGYILNYRRVGVLVPDSLKRVSREEIRKFCRENYASLVEGYLFVREPSRRGGIRVASDTLLAFCHYIFSQTDKEKANVFLDKLIRGIDLSDKDPIYVCRQRLVNCERRTPIAHKAQMIFKGWLAFVDGRTIHKIKLSGKSLSSIAAISS